MSDADALTQLLDEAEGIRLDHHMKYRQHEKDLWGATLIDAISIIMGRIPHKRHEWLSAKAWIESDDDDAGTYRWVCRMLDVHHRRVRKLTLAKAVEPKRRAKI